jgi:hypothetical protein
MSIRKAVIRVRAAAITVAVLAATAPAGAVFTFTPLDSPREVTLRVGSNDTAVNRVTFTVTGANVAPTPIPVTGVPGSGAPATTIANGVEIAVTTRMPASFFSSDTMTLTVNSTAGLTCVGGTGCGTTVIPFNTISWTSFFQDGNGQDITNGTFNGSASQQLASYTVYTGIPWNGQSVNMSNVLVFQYNNATLYPSGRYEGRVIYTATNI